MGLNMNVFSKLVVGSALLLATSFAHAQDVHGVLRVVKGDVQIKQAKTGQTVKARLGEQVYPKDIVITGKEARAKIVMVDNNEINVSPESQIEIQHYEFNPDAGKKDVLLNVIYGKVRAKVEQKYDGQSAKFQIKTPSAVAGVRGTDFMASFDKAGASSSVVTFQGKVEFGVPGPGGTIKNAVFVTPGQSATSVGGHAPSAPAPVPKSTLAKMDKDTKADTGGPGPGANGNGDRQPANDKKDKGDGDKKDSASNGNSGGRQPASSDKGQGGGSSMLDKSDVVGGGGTDNKGMNQLPPPPPPPPPIVNNNNNTNNICDFCTKVIQSGNSKLNVTIKTK